MAIQVSAARRLYRSEADKWIGGVCGGLAEYYGWNANLLRIFFVFCCLLPGPQFLIYLAAWFIMPRAVSK